MPQDKNIYRFLKQNNLTQKSEEEFNSEYNNSPEKQEQLHAFFKDNNLTQKDKDSFTQEYFGSIGKGKGATTEQSKGGTPSPIIKQELPIGIINQKIEDVESLVRRIEGNNNYNAYFSSPKNASIIFEDMTIGEVLDWQRKNKEKAVGVYQFKPDTLKDAINATEGISLDSKFDSSTQDELSNYLFDRRGRQDYINGKIDSIEYANNLAKEFASLPVVTDVVKGSGDKVKRGETYYSGTNNKALISVEEYENIIKNIKPVDSQEQIVSDK